MIKEQNFSRETSLLFIAQMPRILPNCQRTEPVFFRVPFHDDLRKTGFGEKSGQLNLIEDPHSINNRKPLVILGVLSIRLIGD